MTENEDERFDDDEPLKKKTVCHMLSLKGLSEKVPCYKKQSGDWMVPVIMIQTTHFPTLKVENVEQVVHMFSKEGLKRMTHWEISSMKTWFSECNIRDKNKQKFPALTETESACNICDLQENYEQILGALFQSTSYVKRQRPTSSISKPPMNSESTNRKNSNASKSEASDKHKEQHVSSDKRHGKQVASSRKNVNDKRDGSSNKLKRQPTANEPKEKQQSTTSSKNNSGNTDGHGQNGIKCKEGEVTGVLTLKNSCTDSGIPLPKSSSDGNTTKETEKKDEGGESLKENSTAKKSFSKTATTETQNQRNELTLKPKNSFQDCKNSCKTGTGKSIEINDSAVNLVSKEKRNNEQLSKNVSAQTKKFAESDCVPKLNEGNCVITSDSDMEVCPNNSKVIDFNPNTNSLGAFVSNLRSNLAPSKSSENELTQFNETFQNTNLKPAVSGDQSMPPVGWVFPVGANQLMPPYIFMPVAMANSSVSGVSQVMSSQLVSGSTYTTGSAPENSFDSSTTSCFGHVLNELQESSEKKKAELVHLDSKKFLKRNSKEKYINERNTSDWTVSNESRKRSATVLQEDRLYDNSSPKGKKVHFGHESPCFNSDENDLWKYDRPYKHSSSSMVNNDPPVDRNSHFPRLRQYPSQERIPNRQNFSRFSPSRNPQLSDCPNRKFKYDYDRNLPFRQMSPEVPTQYTDDNYLYSKEKIPYQARYRSRVAVDVPPNQFERRALHEVDNPFYYEREPFSHFHQTNRRPCNEESAYNSYGSSGNSAFVPHPSKKNIQEERDHDFGKVISSTLAKARLSTKVEERIKPRLTNGINRRRIPFSPRRTFPYKLTRPHSRFEQDGPKTRVASKNKKQLSRLIISIRNTTSSSPKGKANSKVLLKKSKETKSTTAKTVSKEEDSKAAKRKTTTRRRTMLKKASSKSETTKPSVTSVKCNTSLQNQSFKKTVKDKDNSSAIAKTEGEVEANLSMADFVTLDEDWDEDASYHSDSDSCFEREYSEACSTTIREKENGISESNIWPFVSSFINFEERVFEDFNVNLPNDSTENDNPNILELDKETTTTTQETFSKDNENKQPRQWKKIMLEKATQQSDSPLKSSKTGSMALANSEKTLREDVKRVIDKMMNNVSAKSSLDVQRKTYVCDNDLNDGKSVNMTLNNQSVTTIKQTFSRERANSFLLEKLNLTEGPTGHDTSVGKSTNPHIVPGNEGSTKQLDKSKGNVLESRKCPTNKRLEKNTKIVESAQEDTIGKQPQFPFEDGEKTSDTDKIFFPLNPVDSSSAKNEQAFAIGDRLCAKEAIIPPNIGSTRELASSASDTTANVCPTKVNDSTKLAYAETGLGDDSTIMKRRRSLEDATSSIVNIKTSYNLPINYESNVTENNVADISAPMPPFLMKESNNTSSKDSANSNYYPHTAESGIIDTFSYSSAEESENSEQKDSAEDALSDAESDVISLRKYVFQNEKSLLKKWRLRKCFVSVEKLTFPNFGCKNPSIGEVASDNRNSPSFTEKNFKDSAMVLAKKNLACNGMDSSSRTRISSTEINSTECALQPTNNKHYTTKSTTMTSPTKPQKAKKSIYRPKNVKAPCDLPSDCNVLKVSEITDIDSNLENEKNVSTDVSKIIASESKLQGDFVALRLLKHRKQLPSISSDEEEMDDLSTVTNSLDTSDSRPPSNKGELSDDDDVLLISCESFLPNATKIYGDRLKHTNLSDDKKPNITEDNTKDQENHKLTPSSSNLSLHQDENPHLMASTAQYSRSLLRKQKSSSFTEADFSKKGEEKLKKSRCNKIGRNVKNAWPSWIAMECVEELPELHVEFADSSDAASNGPKESSLDKQITKNADDGNFKRSERKTLKSKSTSNGKKTNEADPISRRSRYKLRSGTKTQASATEIDDLCKNLPSVVEKIETKDNTLTLISSQKPGPVTLFQGLETKTDVVTSKEENTSHVITKTTADSSSLLNVIEEPMLNKVITPVIPMTDKEANVTKESRDELTVSITPKIPVSLCSVSGKVGSNSTKRKETLAAYTHDKAPVTTIEQTNSTAYAFNSGLVLKSTASDFPIVCSQALAVKTTASTLVISSISTSSSSSTILEESIERESTKRSLNPDLSTPIKKVSKFSKQSNMNLTLSQPQRSFATTRSTENANPVSNSSIPPKKRLTAAISSKTVKSLSASKTNTQNTIVCCNNQATSISTTCTNTDLPLPSQENVLDGIYYHGILEVEMKAPALNLDIPLNSSFSPESKIIFLQRRIPYIKVKKTTSRNKFRTTQLATNSSNKSPSFDSDANLLLVRIQDVAFSIHQNTQAVIDNITQQMATCFLPNSFIDRVYTNIYSPIEKYDSRMANLLQFFKTAASVLVHENLMIDLDDYLKIILPKFYMESFSIPKHKLPEYIKVRTYKPIQEIDSTVMQTFSQSFGYNYVFILNDVRIKHIQTKRGGEVYCTQSEPKQKRKPSKDSTECDSVLPAKAIKKNSGMKQLPIEKIPRPALQSATSSVNVSLEEPQQYPTAPLPLVQDSVIPQSLSTSLTVQNATATLTSASSGTQIQQKVSPLPILSKQPIKVFFPSVNVSTPQVSSWRLPQSIPGLFHSRNISPFHQPESLNQALDFNVGLKLGSSISPSIFNVTANNNKEPIFRSSMEQQQRDMNRYTERSFSLNDTILTNATYNFPKASTPALIPKSVLPIKHANRDKVCTAINTTTVTPSPNALHHNDRNLSIGAKFLFESNYSPSRSLIRPEDLQGMCDTRPSSSLHLSMRNTNGNNNVVAPSSSALDLEANLSSNNYEESKGRTLDLSMPSTTQRKKTNSTLDQSTQVSHSKLHSPVMNNNGVRPSSALCHDINNQNPTNDSPLQIKSVYTLSNHESISTKVTTSEFFKSSTSIQNLAEKHQDSNWVADKVKDIQNSEASCPKRKDEHPLTNVSHKLGRRGRLTKKRTTKPKNPKELV